MFYVAREISFQFSIVGGSFASELRQNPVAHCLVSIFTNFFEAAHAHYLVSISYLKKTRMEVITLSPKSKPGLEHSPLVNYVAFTIDRDPHIRVYKNDSSGELVHVFDKHIASPRRKMGLVHLSDGVMCSLILGGKLIIWNGITAKVINSWPATDYVGIYKMSDTRLALLKNSKLVVLAHERNRLE